MEDTLPGYVALVLMRLQSDQPGFLTRAQAAYGSRVRISERPYRSHVITSSAIRPPMLLTSQRHHSLPPLQVLEAALSDMPSEPTLTTAPQMPAVARYGSLARKL